jgi:hypothetical protein
VGGYFSPLGQNPAKLFVISAEAMQSIAKWRNLANDKICHCELVPKVRSEAISFRILNFGYLNLFAPLGVLWRI